MRKLVSGCLIVGAGAIGAGTAGGAIVLGPVVNPSNGHSYYLLSPNTWTGAEAEAVALGGHLATIRSAQENDWVFQTFGQSGGSGRTFYIGLNDQAVEGTFVWSSGETSAYRNFQAGKPDNFGGNQDYVLMWGDDVSAPAFDPGRWDDNQNVANAGVSPSVVSVYGLMEVVPEPGACLACTAAFALLAGRRRDERGAA